MTNLDPSHCKLLAALTLAAFKHLGGDSVVVDADANLSTGRMARIGSGIALVAKPADDQSPPRIDAYQVVDHSPGGAAFKLDPARLVYSLRAQHNARPPDSS